MGMPKGVGPTVSMDGPSSHSPPAQRTGQQTNLQNDKPQIPSEQKVRDDAFANTKQTRLNERETTEPPRCRALIGYIYHNRKKVKFFGTGEFLMVISPLCCNSTRYKNFGYMTGSQRDRANGIKIVSPQIREVKRMAAEINTEINKVSPEFGTPPRARSNHAEHQTERHSPHARLPTRTPLPRQGLLFPFPSDTKVGDQYS